jgi:hypothetical protein
MMERGPPAAARGDARGRTVCGVQVREQDAGADVCPNVRGASTAVIIKTENSVQGSKKRRQCLRLHTSRSTFSRFWQITRSPRTLVIIWWLDKSTSLKTSAFLASQILHKRGTRTANKSFASK